MNKKLTADPLAIIAPASLLLLISGARVLILERKIHAGEPYEAPDYGDLKSLIAGQSGL